MKKSNSIIGILASLVIGGLILLGGSQGSLQIDGLPLFALCGAIGFVLHWLMFVPAYAFQTEHYFDLTGSISYITTVVAVVMLNSSLDLRDLILCAMIVIWAVRLGSFLFWRIKKGRSRYTLYCYENSVHLVSDDLDPGRALGVGYNGGRIGGNNV